MVHGLGTWTMHERGLRLDSWACTVVVNLGSVKWYPNNVVDQRPRTFIGRWPRVNHHHEGCGTKTQALGTGFQAKAPCNHCTAPQGSAVLWGAGLAVQGSGFEHWWLGSSTALHSRRQCIAMHSPHTSWCVHARKCRISYLNFLEFFTQAFRIFSREGGDLQDEILSVISWKNKRKCQKMVLFSWKTWKMVKYFISILAIKWLYFG